MAEAGDAGTPAAAPAVAGRISGEVTSREDALRALDKISQYFRRHEPSSPVPLILERAKRIIDKDFMDILKDLSPDGVSQARTIFGLEDDSGY